MSVIDETDAELLRSVLMSDAASDGAKLSVVEALRRKLRAAKAAEKEERECAKPE